MTSAPPLRELLTIAAQCGISLKPEEAEAYRDEVTRNLALVADFMMSTASGKAVNGPRRDSGHRPSPEEDPHNAWLWKCRIPGSGTGTLRGKTLSFKGNVAIAGAPMTIGAPTGPEGTHSDLDATIVERALAAGGEVVGHNTMDGLGDWTGFGAGWGRGAFVRNPHAADHVTGGTSSGSVVAVARGEVDISFGGDQAGSVRIPAAWSGAVGLKPTFGLVSHFGVIFPSEQSVDHVGPITRTVEDAAAALQAVAGYDGLDSRQGRDIPDRIDALTSLRQGVSGLRVGVLEEAFTGAEDDVAGLVRAAADVLADAGAVVRTVSVPEHEYALAPLLTLHCEGMRAAVDTGLFGMFTRTPYPASLIETANRLWRRQDESLSPLLKLQFLVGEISRRTYHGGAYARAQNTRGRFTAAYDKALSDVDLLLMPTCAMKAPRAPGTPADLEDVLRNEIGGAAIRNTAPFNFTGHPALALPCGKSHGLPVSLQLVGRRLEDALVLRAGYAFQQSVPFAEYIAIGAPGQPTFSSGR